MKKTNFTLKLLGSDVVIYHNGSKVKKVGDFKKALRAVALIIHHKNIENFELHVWERGKMEKINDFDPEIILNYGAGKINKRFDDEIDLEEDDERDIRRRLFSDEDEDDDDIDISRKRFLLDRDDRDPRLQNRIQVPTWRHTPSSDSETLEEIKHSISRMFPKTN